MAVGSTTRLFSHPGLVFPFPQQMYDVSQDGRRFLLAEAIPDEDAQGAVIRVVLNWYEEFRDRERD